MKKFLVALALVCFMAIPAFAVDKVLNTQIDSATIAIDKNGNQYVRLIINEDRKLQGVEYTVGVPVMAFGNLATQAKALKAGQMLKAVVASREYRGNTSYTIRAFLK
jgi:hypothetical protein